MTDELEAFVADRRGELAALALELLAIDTANPPGDTREIVAVHAIDEYTTVDAPSATRRSTRASPNGGRPRPTGRTSGHSGH
ncbi:acetylornithine deacetylase/succinyl-diaminopimelate desuccinylase [Natrinema thermotolerans DSM 11552]|nr:acetylornithine deacetylase/succinyl-diaminopimelate desuccinylase [Natrinema thermotolerans DSM 11552]